MNFLQVSAYGWLMILTYSSWRAVVAVVFWQCPTDNWRAWMALSLSYNTPGALMLLNCKEKATLVFGISSGTLAGAIWSIYTYSCLQTTVRHWESLNELKISHLAFHRRMRYCKLRTIWFSLLEKRIWQPAALIDLFVPILFSTWVLP